MTLSAGARCAVAALAALVMAAASLLYCERAGRLSMDLQYDDVSYAVDAADRLDALRNDGLPGLARSLVQAPPHSPYSTLLGVAAFAAAGVRDLALYAANAFLPLAAALLAVLLTRRHEDGVFLVVLGLVIPSALAFHAQTEYRPDVAYGLAMACMVAAFASAGSEGRPRRAALAGLALGAALLIKPSFFPHTLAIAAFLVAVSTFARVPRLPPAIRALALPGSALASFVAVGVLVAAPYYATAAEQVFGYFWSNTFGSHGSVHNLAVGFEPIALWRSFEPFLFQLPRYHLAATFFATIVFLVALVLRRAGREAAYVGLLFAAAVVSTAIILAGRQPNPFFFATADWLFMASAAAGFAALAATLRPRDRRLLCFAAALALVPLSFSSLRNLQAAWPPGARHDDSENERLLAAMRADLRRHGWTGPMPMLQVVVDSSGPVNPMVLRWVARLKGMRVYGDEVHLAGTLQPLQEASAVADYVVAIRPDRAPFDQWLPLARVQRAFHDWALSDPRFERVDTGARDSAYTLLANRDTTARFSRRRVVAADGGILAVKSLAGAVEDAARAIENGSATACFSLPAGVPQEVVLAYAAQGTGRIDVRANGDSIAAAALQPGVPGRIEARFTPVRWAPNCIDVRVAGAPGRPAPEVVVQQWSVGPAS